MKPEAIHQSAIELIEAITATSQPANEVINAYTRSRRYIGSKDRRHLTDLVWSYLRHKARLNYLYPLADVATKLKALPDCPETIPDAPNHVNWEVPEWLIPLIPNAEKELPALLQLAPIVLRANGNRDAIQQKLSDEGLITEKTEHSPYGLILMKRTNLTASPTYQRGEVEIQDEGSQLVALATDIQPHDTVLDYCAGAGGKSLIFAQMMGNKGRIVAHDISDRSLTELRHRADRAGATCITVQKPVQEKDFDHVVVDAPCSGTGTWRRCPDARWKLTQEQLMNVVRTQADILDKTAPLVRIGGKLSYMTCSLTRLENGDQADAFIQRHPEFVEVNRYMTSPATTHTDGLFIATFERRN